MYKILIRWFRKGVIRLWEQKQHRICVVRMCYGPECCIYLLIVNTACILTSSLPGRHYSLCTNEPILLSPERLNLYLEGCALSDCYNEQNIIKVFFSGSSRCRGEWLLNVMSVVHLSVPFLLQFFPFTSKTNIRKLFAIKKTDLQSCKWHCDVQKDQYFKCILVPESQKLVCVFAFRLLASFKPRFGHFCKTFLYK